MQCHTCTTFFNPTGLLEWSTFAILGQARIWGTSHQTCASVWLWAILPVLLGLILSAQELVVTLHFWLGIPVFSNSMRCSCGTVISEFWDYVLSCGNSPIRICRHNAPCEVIWYALIQNHRQQNYVHCQNGLGQLCISPWKSHHYVRQGCGDTTTTWMDRNTEFSQRNMKPSKSILAR